MYAAANSALLSRSASAVARSRRLLRAAWAWLTSSSGIAGTGSGPACPPLRFKYALSTRCATRSG